MKKLNNIKDSITYNRTYMDEFNTSYNEFDIEEKDFLDLIETSLHVIDDIILLEPMIFSKPDMNSIIANDTAELLSLQMENINNCNTNNYKLKYIIKLAMNYYFSYIYPCRSYPCSKILRKPNITIIQNKINYLTNIPQPEQRTNDWYLFRYNLLTASNIWKAYGSEKTQNQLIYEKCKPINLDKYNSVNMESSLHWGQKYEPISIEWYEKHYNTTVTDFGCIPHSELSYIGASPDGINTDPSSSRYGRMLEVKNIVNREITGIPKMEYWIQMQIQMEVCNLNECDFLETRFVEYEDYNSFINDGEFNTSESNNTKGIIMCFIKDEKPLYVYAPLYISKTEFEEWEEKIMEEHKHLTWLKNIYWKLDEISCVLVLRNKFWFHSTKHMLDKIWKNIIYDRIHGYEHRAPKKNKKESIQDKNVDVKCNIVIETETKDKNNVVETKTNDEINIQDLHANIKKEKNEIVNSTKTDVKVNKNVIVINI
mgnify:FL=1